MLITDSIKSSFTTILAHKMRSLLTLLGLIIGVAAVVTMFSAVYGIKANIKESIEKLGFNNSIVVRPGKDEFGSKGEDLDSCI